MAAFSLGLRFALLCALLGLFACGNDPPPEPIAPLAQPLSFSDPCQDTCSVLVGSCDKKLPGSCTEAELVSSCVRRCRATREAPGLGARTCKEVFSALLETDGGRLTCAGAQSPGSVRCTKHSRATYRGDLRVEAQEDLEVLGAKTCILGNLTIESETLRSIDVLEELEEVRGSLKISGSPHLEDLGGLRALEEVSGDLILGDEATVRASAPVNLSLVSAEGLRKLRHVGGDLQILLNPALQEVDFSTLQTVGGDLHVGRSRIQTSCTQPGGVFHAPSRFRSLDLPSLAHVGGDFRVEGQETLEVLHAPVLLRVGRSLILGSWVRPSLPLGCISNELPRPGDLGSPRLQEIDLSSLENAGHHVRISGNASLERLSLPSIRRIPGNLDLMHNTSLRGLSMERLSFVGGNLRLHSNGPSFDVQTPSLEAIRGNLELGMRSPGMIWREIGGEYVRTQEIRAFTTRISSLEGFSNLRNVGGLSIQHSTSLENLSGLRHLEQISRDLRLNHNHFVSLEGLESLQEVGGNLSVSEEPHLEDLGRWENLRFVGGDLHIGYSGHVQTPWSEPEGSCRTYERPVGLPSLRDFDGFDALEGVGGDLQVQNLCQIHALEGFGSLSEVHGDLILGRNTMPELPLVYLGASDSCNRLPPACDQRRFRSLRAFEVLHEVQGDLRINRNRYLTSLRALKNLHQVGGDLQILNVNLSSAEQNWLLERLEVAGEVAFGPFFADP